MKHEDHVLWVTISIWVEIFKMKIRLNFPFAPLHKSLYVRHSGAVIAIIGEFLKLFGLKTPNQRFKVDP